MACCRTFYRTEGLTSKCHMRSVAYRRLLAQDGQSTVEAAVVLPVLMLLFALLMQPVCVLYTRMVMRHAAAQTARVLATSADEQICRSFALRRLAAVPEVSVFHVGGSGDWKVSMSRSDDARVCEVRITGHLRPLPLFGVAANVLGTRDQTGLLVEEAVRERMRPSWLGGEYESWMEAW